MALLMVCYPVTRFAIESLRDDDPAIALGLTLSQLISAGLFPCGLIAWWWVSKRPPGRYADRVEAIEALSGHRPMGGSASRGAAEPAIRR